MPERAHTRASAAVLFVAPAVLLAGVLAHPFVRDYTDRSVVAGAISGAPGRWAASHLIIPVGIGLVLVAVAVMAGQFRHAGEQRWSVSGRSLLIVGGTLLAASAGSEITLAAVVNSGGDVLAVLEAGATSATLLFLAGVLLFVLGWLSFAMAFYRVPILPRSQNRLAIVVLVAIPIATFIPQTTGTYVYAGAVLVVSWLVGYRMIAGEGPPQITS